MSDTSPSNSILEKLANAIHSLWKVVQDLLHLAGYIAVAFFLIYTFRHPDNVRGFLNDVGLEHAEIAGIRFDFTKVATAANNASFHADEILTTLKTLNAASLDSATRSKVDSMAASAEELNGELKALGVPVKKAIETQSQTQPSSQSGTALAGWMFLGRTDNAVEKWDTTKETVPMPISRDKGPKFNSGETVKVNTDAYVRADGPDFALTSHRIIGVVPEGATVRIEELRPNRIRSGGNYLWAKVEVVQ